MTWQRGETGGIGSGKMWKRPALDGQAMLLPKPSVCTAGEKSGGLRQDMGDRQG